LAFLILEASALTYSIADLAFSTILFIEGSSCDTSKDREGRGVGGETKLVILEGFIEWYL